LTVGLELILLAADFGAERDLRIIGKDGLGGGGEDGTGRTTDEPAHQLLPEHFVGFIFERLGHLPAPSATGGHDGRSATAIVLGDEERRAAMIADGVNVNHRAGLDGSWILEIGEEGQFFPAFGVAGGILFDAKSEVVAAIGREFYIGFVAEERDLTIADNDRKDVFEIAGAIAAIGK
jgi:hypothetical protein